MSDTKQPDVLPITGFPDVDQFLADTFEVMRKKGHDYRQGNDADLLHNFRTVADNVGSDMMKVWFTYFYKHYSAMVTYIKEGGQSESEPIEGRITDQIVYLVLFWKMVQEKKGKKVDVTQQINKLINNLYDNNYGNKRILDTTVNKSKSVVVLEGAGIPVKIDAQRAYELAGGEGVNTKVVLPERALEITEVLNERDRERAAAANGEGFSNELSKTFKEMALKEAMEDAKPIVMDVAKEFNDAKPAGSFLVENAGEKLTPVEEPAIKLSCGCTFMCHGHQEDGTPL